MKYIAILITATLVFANPTFAGTARVIDGDTIEIGDIRYRINGIDAPEAGQKCAKANGKSWRCGKAAIKAMAALVDGNDVQCTTLTNDGYGREVATCLANSNDIGAAMVRRGLAWAFVKYSDVYVAEERLAKSESIGIWQGKAQPAWEYRAAKWAVAEQVSPKGCPIKGNISKNGRIYHPPWSPWYKRTRINTAKGERWFCNEAEAIAAGWRAPRWK